MTMYQSPNGKWYGTLECLLLKVVVPERGEPYTEVLVGSRSPFGGIMVNDVRGLVPQHPWNECWKGREESVEWWEGQGFDITMPSLFSKIQEQNRRVNQERAS